MPLPSVVITVAWRSYLQRLQKDPLLTKAITSAVLSVCSEVFAKRLRNLPLKSSAAMHELTIGLVLRGPLIHAFHNFLDKVVFKGAKQTSPTVVLGKLIIDQFIFAPIFTSLYFYFRALSEDRSVATTTKRLKSELLGIMKKNWSLWVPANFINYMVIPLELRVLFGSVVAFFWNAYLISQASRTER
ncbi:Peroxisomal membrane protein 2 [Gracilariopsis chorda]|uniref:Peroxisomal membrane protein 2 n=1 Tax=Gracilariopsis chorda TaxID=448386 RepID=A0A2V3J221_9FLOR|nr:Peroxisomal membrane protein 2 [Gracilariopsis chorda]|eukprot:PXF48434.1 Peroxisomal membrane protein 2 [Gracilariopsis chorda]